jgi:hypothetical protein
MNTQTQTQKRLMTINDINGYMKLMNNEALIMLINHCNSYYSTRDEEMVKYVTDRVEFGQWTIEEVESAFDILDIEYILYDVIADEEYEIMTGYLNINLLYHIIKCINTAGIDETLQVAYAEYPYNKEGNYDYTDSKVIIDKLSENAHKLIMDKAFNNSSEKQWLMDRVTDESMDIAFDEYNVYVKLYGGTPKMDYFILKAVVKTMSQDDYNEWLMEFAI